MVEKMIRTVTASTSTISATVDVALNLVVSDDERKKRNISMEWNEPEQHNGQQQQPQQQQQQQKQFLFINENDDKNDSELSNERTVPDWTGVVQIAKTVTDNNRYNKQDEEKSKKSVKVTTVSSEAHTFDFTKIETLFSKSTTTSNASKPDSEQIDIKDDDSRVDEKVQMSNEEVKIKDSVLGNIVVTEGNSKVNSSIINNNNNNKNNSNNNNNNNNNNSRDSSQLQNNDLYSLNGTTEYAKKSTKCLNRYGKDRKRKIIEKRIRSREPSTSPSFQRPLTPSLDPKLLKKFEEEDRPKRVLRSSTIAASIPKNNNFTNSTIISDSSNKTIDSDFNIKMTSKKSVKRKTVQKDTKQAKRKMSEKVSANFTANNTFPVENIFYSTQINDKVKRRRSQSKDVNKAIELHSKHLKGLKVEMNGLLDNDLMMTIHDLKNTTLRTRRWSGLSNSRASTSNSGSNGFTAIVTQMKKRREISHIGRSNFSSNWKLAGTPCEKPVYIDYFFHEKQSTKQMCYPKAIHSKTGDNLRFRDSVRVNSVDGEPNFAYICCLFNDPRTGIPLASVLWYYTPMQVKTDDTLVPPVFERELLASKHMDIIPLDTIDEIIWVLTYNEYGRFMAETRNDTYPLAQRVSEENLLWKKGEDNYPRRLYLPCDDTPLELVYFCRRIYDCKQQKVETKNWRKKTSK